MISSVLHAWEVSGLFFQHIYRRNGFPSCRIALIEEGLFWEEVMGYSVGIGEEIEQERS